MTVVDHRLPSIAIAGAEKAGTTSLSRYLGASADVQSHEQLEFRYFVDDVAFRRGYEAEFARCFGPPGSDARHVLVKSVGIMFLESARSRLHDLSPECQIVCLVREPASRAYSAFHYLRAVGLEPLSRFEDALAAEPQRLERDFARFHPLAYRARGIYIEQIEALELLFGRERVHVVVMDDLVADPLATVASLAEELGIDPLTIDDGVVAQRHNEAATVRSRGVGKLVRSPALIGLGARVSPATRARIRAGLAAMNQGKGATIEPMSPGTRSQLRRSFADSVAALESRLGRCLPAWHD